MIIYCLNLELNRIFLYVRCQNNKSVERSVERSLERSVERSLERSVERSLERSLERSVERSVERSDEHILLEAEIYYNYLQKYKPISIIKKIETTIDNDDNDKLLDIYVKENMICGINTVHEEHCCFQDLTLFKLDKIRHCKNTNNEYVENLITKYLCKNRTIEEILFEKQELENTLEKYKKEKQELENISIDGSQIIENIRWIKEKCRNMNKNKNENENEKKIINKKENINRYRNILFLLNQVYTILTSTSTFSTYSKNISDIYIKYPKFLLDDFFCHWHRTHLEEYMKEVEIFCSIYEEMTNVIIQKMKEIESNIKTYDDDLEWKISRALYMLNKEYTNLMLQ
jgi:hypothetical protein